MYQMIERFSYWDLVKKIGFTLILQLLLAQICYLKDAEAYENFMSFFTFLFIASTSVLAVCVIKEKDDKLAMMAIIMQDIGIALQAMLGVMNNQKTMMIMGLSLLAAVLFVMIMNALSSTAFFKRHAVKLWGLVLIAAVLIMLVFGKAMNGVAAWIPAGKNTLQITEIIKFICLIFFSAVFTSPSLSQCQKYLSCTLMMVVLAVSLLYVSELGTALLMILVYLLAVYLFLDKKYTRITLIGSGICLVIGVLSIFIILHFQQRLEAAGLAFLVNAANKISQRTLLVFHPQALSETGLDYQLSCARKAMVMGGLLGNNQSIYIPVAESDFIFIVLLTKMGVLTGLLVILLQTGMVVQGLRMNMLDYHSLHFKQALSILFILEIGLRAFIMIAGTIGLIPVTGLAMPLLALGGTATLLTYCAIGYIIFASVLYKKRPRRRH